MLSALHYNSKPKTAPQGQPYFPSSELVAAVNVALLLGRPLLVTGAPGTGKTSLAQSVAADLQLPLYRFDTKSGSCAPDLFYRYDAISHFRKSQLSSAECNVADFIEIHALGESILRASAPSALRSQLLGEANENPMDAARSVVLIDEIDKAPRDFPNDLLNEIENFSFHIPELGKEQFRVRGNELRPILILTSNSEKNLPEPFIRRCIFCDIPFPDENQLESIVIAHLPDIATVPWFGEACRFFHHVRQKRMYSRLPATAELLDWMRIMTLNESINPFAVGQAGKRPLDALRCLFKTRSDLEEAGRDLTRFLESRD